jgi:hypothetical protein
MMCTKLMLIHTAHAHTHPHTRLEKRSSADAVLQYGNQNAAQKRTGKYDGVSYGHRSFADNQVDIVNRPNPASEYFSGNEK